MAMTIISGDNFSGRSDTLRGFAWQRPGGQYLHPDLELNLSGLANTVAGERFLHDLTPTSGDDRSLRSLSGGERSQLVVECALGAFPQRLAIDGVLEQLDGRRRRAVMARLQHVAIGTEVWLADNMLRAGARSEVIHSYYVTKLPQFNQRLFETAQVVSRTEVEAPTIRLHDLHFSYPGSSGPIFAHANYEFRPGAVYLLKAPNGSGKSTLARLLIGLLMPSSGTITLEGASFRSIGSSPLFYAFQNPRDQVFGRSARDYLNRVSQLAASRDRYKTAAWNGGDPMQAFGLAGFEEVELWDLPPVALKRLGLAAAFLSQAPWLFLDEPALGLDLTGQDALVALFVAAAQSGRGIIVVTHGTEFDDGASARELTIDGHQLRNGGPAWT